jgi:hypothetical protein
MGLGYLRGTKQSVGGSFDFAGDESKIFAQKD